MLRSTILAVLAVLALAPLAARAATGDRLDRSRLVQTFSESFSRLDLYDLQTKPHARWKSSYDFGAPQTPSSRTLPAEFEIYSDRGYNGVDPFEVKEGALTITAQKNNARNDTRSGGKPYTSGILTTSHSFSQVYGYFEMQASLPAVPGAWPAFWLAAPIDPTILKPQLPGEIDVMELLGNNPSIVFCSTHWSDADGVKRFTTDAVKVGDVTHPHLYGVLWTHDAIVWYVDNVEVDRKPNPGLDRPMFILVNLAVGGWNNNVPDPSSPTMRMRVYHVQAFSLR